MVEETWKKMKRYIPRRKPVGIQNSPFNSLRLRRDGGNEVIDDNERAMIAKELIFRFISSEVMIISMS